MRISDWSSDVCSSDLHHGSAAALAADELGRCVDLGSGEGDHRRARRQTGQLLRAAVGEGGEARPSDEFRLGHQLLEHRTDGLGAQEHGLGDAAGVQQAVGEDVSALGVGAELRSEEHTSELQSLMRISYAVFCLKKKKPQNISK